MTHNLDTVKSASESKNRYHHGNLRAALIAAAETVLADKGVNAFSLRETARRSGVSPAAPAHHFKDARGLLTALAARGFDDLTESLKRAAIAAADVERLRAIGRAYIEFAQERPALFSMMWARDKLDVDDPEYLSAGRRAFNVLECAAMGRDVPVASGPHLPEPSIIAAWSMIHGYARLAIDGALVQMPESTRDSVLQLLPHQTP